MPLLMFDNTYSRNARKSLSDPVYAKKLVDRFGEKIFDVIENESARLEELDGIGPKRRKRIKGRSSKWDNNGQSKIPFSRKSCRHLFLSNCMGFAMHIDAISIAGSRRT